MNVVNNGTVERQLNIDTNNGDIYSHKPTYWENLFNRLKEQMSSEIRYHEIIEDLVEYRTKLENDFSFMSYVPFLFISAKTGQRVDKLYDMIVHVNEQNSMRISTGMLNDVLAYATTMVQPPSDKGKRLKIYYSTQVSVKPPTFVIFVNDKELMHFSYLRYFRISSLFIRILSKSF